MISGTVVQPSTEEPSAQAEPLATQESTRQSPAAESRVAEHRESAVDPCEAIIRLHSKSFALASRLLPKRARNDAVALYAWCRLCDDAVDCPQEGRDPVHEVRRLRDDLHAIYAGRITHSAVNQQFQQVIQRRQIPRLYPEHLLDGLEADAGGQSIRTGSDLLRYCYQVAGTVGLMMSHVLGIRHERALLHAAHLGMAMQLTNIARDVAEDWQRQRCYLPSDWLSGASAMDDLRVRPAVCQLLHWADQLYQSGEDGLKYLDFPSRLGVHAARHVYGGIGQRLAARGYSVCQGRVVLSRWTKILLALRAGLEVTAKTLLGPRPPQGPIRLPGAIWEYQEPQLHETARLEESRKNLITSDAQTNRTTL